MRRVPKQHSVSGRQSEGVASGLFPGEVCRLGHELARLHAAELGKRAIRRLVAPNGLRWREERIPSIAFLVVAIVLIAVNDDLVAHLPATHFGAARPHDAGCIRSGNMEGMLVHVERRDRNAEAGPDTVVVDASRHDVDQNLILSHLPGRQQLELHGALRRTVALLADGPGMHLRRHVAQRGYFADPVMLFEGDRAAGFGESGHGVSARSLPRQHPVAFHAAVQQKSTRLRDQSLAAAKVSVMLSQASEIADEFGARLRGRQSWLESQASELADEFGARIRGRPSWLESTASSS